MGRNKVLDGLLSYSAGRCKPTIFVRFAFLVLCVLVLAVSSNAVADPLVTNPLPGDPVTNGTETFQWSANGEDVAQWWLQVGTSVGGKEIHNSGSINRNTLSTTVSNLPTDGSTVWVRLWYDSATWKYVDYQYTATTTSSGGGEPEVTLPVPGSALSGGSATFQWDANGSVISSWTLTAGSSVGGSEYFNSGTLGSGTLSTTVTGLPDNGSNVWVRLSYVTDQQYNIDYQYTATTTSSGGGEPEVTLPVPGSALSGGSATFQWSANGEDVTQWWLHVGTSVGGKEIHNSGSINRNTLSTAVSNLPTDGSTVWVRLWYDSATWEYVDYQYTATTASSGGGEPEITLPVPGSEFSGGSATFQWDANGSVISSWTLTAGSSVGGSEYFNSGTLGSGTLSTTVTGLPDNGSNVWVRLSYVTDQQYNIDYQYTATTTSSGGGEPEVTLPVPGSALSGGSATFQWDANGSVISSWTLTAGSSVGGSEYFNSGTLASGTLSTTVTGLPDNGSNVWVRLSYVTDQQYNIDYQYTATTTSSGGGEPEITLPVPGSALSGGSATFQWNANGEDVAQWWLQVGTSVGGKEIHNSGSINRNTLSTTVSNLPTDGSTVWVRLWYDSATWKYVDYQYTATTTSSGGGEPEVTLPVPGSALSGGSATFQWDANGSVISSWTLTAGSSVGGSEYFNSGTLGSGTLSTTVTGLPDNGSNVWVRLSYVTDQQYNIDYQYTATTTSSGGGEPEVTLPVPGSALSGGSATFQWSANGEDVTQWWLHVGTSVGGKEIHNSGSINRNTLSTAVSNLPTDGSTVWVRLWYDSATWEYVDYQYTATTASSGGGEPEITLPVPGSEFSGGSATFQWDANGSVISSWTLTAGSSVGGSEYFNSGTLASGTLSTTVTGLPDNGSNVWVRLSYVTDQQYNIDYQYTATTTSSGGGEPEVTLPVPGSALSGESATFQWSANGEDVTQWWLYVGTSVGGKEIYDSGSINRNTLSTTISSLPTDGSTVWVRLWYDSATWDFVDVQYIAGGSGVGLVSPLEGELKHPDDVDVQATASGFPQNWRVDFVLDGQFNNAVQGTRAQGTDTWFASLGDLSKQAHTLTAIMVDENDNQQSEYSDEISFDVGDYYVAFGDSISEGIGDDFSADNQSQDGRNNSRGYTPILNDLLTANKGYPHNVVVEGIDGYDAGDGLAEIDSALAAHPESSHFLIQFGTNDSSEPVPSGLGKQQGRGGYPGTFKDNMQRIINAVQSAGKIALLAKAPIRYADCSLSSQCQSYEQRGISPPGNAAANGFVREYNEVVDELIQENGLELDPVAMPGVLLVAPDLYDYYNATGLDFEGKSPKFFDWLHPNGVGYQDMAVLWRDALLP